MSKRYTSVCFIFILHLGHQSIARVAESFTDRSSNDPIQSFTKDMKKHKGFFTFYYNEETGSIFLEVDKLGEEFLYVNSLAAGVGSNDIGLDRGQLGQDRVVRFEKHGNKILLFQSNYGYRAMSKNEDEVKSVAEAFANSVLGGFEIKTKNNSSHLVDITDWLMRDAHGVSARLKRTNQGDYKVDKSRSAVYRDATFNFPENTEFESILTFYGEAKGAWVKSVVPTPNAVTVRLHHSFIKLPDANYQPRQFDSRSGYGFIFYQDYATPIEDPLIKRYIKRHRLEKENPASEVSEAVEPIVYYLDRGTPEPIRSALIEGAKWWNQAFEAAGFKDAFQVEILPKGVHPLDVRYNVIQWVHRSTRGWSYGASVIDPRTGEIIKGHVSLGSLRARQDFLIATGLLQPYINGDEKPSAMTDLALARLRQLSAHEVGHTLGLAHNFSASVKDRSSVMDYPHPYIKLDETGNIDLSEAYDDKIGAWDKTTIRYGYTQFPEGENQEKLSAILNEAFASGAKYITDQDARPISGLNPYAHLWDIGVSASAELSRIMRIRQKILNDFSEKAIKSGMPMSNLEEVLVPMYLLHRYQVDATSKLIGGLEYSYALRGDGNLVTKMVSTDDQMAALAALLATVNASALKLPESLLEKIPPRPFGYPRSRETFLSKTGPAFDYLAAVETASSLPFNFIFNADRFNRLLTYKARASTQPGVDQILDRVYTEVWTKPSSSSLDRTIQKVVETEMLKHLMSLAINERAYGEVKAKANEYLLKIQTYAASKKSQTADSDGAYYTYIANQIDRFMDDPTEYGLPKPIKAPDGSPIGSCDF